jgi:hypothetical protein
MIYGLWSAGVGRFVRALEGDGGIILACFNYDEALDVAASHDCVDRLKPCVVVALDHNAATWDNERVLPARIAKEAWDRQARWLKSREAARAGKQREKRERAA